MTSLRAVLLPALCACLWACGETAVAPPAPDASPVATDAGSLQDAGDSDAGSSPDAGNSPADAGCTPACSGRSCGDDGCGGSCGTCSGAGQTCVEATGACVVCTPDCSGLECGVDPICGTSCGTCLTGAVCNAEGQCDDPCTPDCGTFQCGPDPVCSTLGCGTCGTGSDCDQGQCIASCVPDCQGRVCGPDPVCGQLDCGTCAAGSLCDASGKCGPACGNSCDPFSVMLIPDTQYYTSKQAAGEKNSLFKQFRWILANRTSHDIRFVIHLGDITNNNRDSQWVVADAAYDLLDAAGMPYSILPGNHDYRDDAKDGLAVRGSSKIDAKGYFPPSRFAGKPWYGGALNGSSTNNYTLFESGPYKFMVISLEYGPRKEALCWAENLIASHPDRRVIIASHCIQTHGAGFNLNCPSSEYDMVGGSGKTIFDELAKRHSNVFLLASGHIHDSEYKLLRGLAGNPIHAVLTDYQMEGVKGCKAGTYTGNGWMRELVFTPRENLVYVRTFTVEDGNTTLFAQGKPALYCDTFNKNPASSDHQYSFAYDLSTPLAANVRREGEHAFNDFTVNDVSAGNQRAPVVAGRPTGGFVVAWEDDSDKSDGEGSYDVMLRGFAPGGCEAFSQRLASASGAGQQLAPALGVAADGSFVVAWEDDADANGTFQIRARGFAADGKERFAPITVNAVADGQQRRPALAMAADGRFTVAWEDDRDKDGKPQVWVRGFEANGTQRFAERSVHADAAGVRQRPAITALPNGGFLVAWEDDGDANGTFQIHARGFNADGTERLARLTVNSASAGQQRNPVVGADDQGRFVAAWEDDPESDGKYQILIRGFESNGSQRFADKRAHSVAGGQHRGPSLAVAGKGAFAVTWQDDGDDNGSYQVRMAGFSATGSASLAEQTVNRIAAGQQLAPAAAIDATGTITVVWQDDLDANETYELMARGVGWTIP